jgi:hypothetical protein
MSALGQKQTFAVQKGMSALPPKADITEQCFAWVGEGRAIRTLGTSRLAKSLEMLALKIRTL